MNKILIIEDDWDINEVLVLYLKNAGFEVYTATTLAAGEKQLCETPIDLILLDVNLPDGNGFDFAKKIRKQFDTIIIFVTIHHYIEQKLQGFEVGGDDYITKPFIPKEVVARVQAQLRRKGTTINEQVIELDNLRIDLDQKEVYKDGERVNLFTKEKKLLFYLVENANKVVSSEQIINEVWGFDGIADSKTVAVHISTLRRKIGDSYSKGSGIQTVRGFGYKFVTNE
ncbi:response regulator transcription factor [Lysinibacillus sp. KU-BSD001]|uniref:response regulator transcription factor n=1 Tax=Lysinibacillus sp. KU-BSD001 TaxID=3141328 RepID=UPI0036E60F0B